MKDLGSNEYKWWAWVDLNYRPHAYQACALTGLSYRPYFKFFNDYTYTHRKRNDDGENPAIFTKLMAFYSKNLKILTNQYQ